MPTCRRQTVSAHASPLRLIYVRREKEPMETNHLIMNLIGIVAGFTAAIVAIYVWLIPSFFNEYKSYSFLIAGVCGAALIGGGCCHKVNNFKGKSAKKLLPYLCGLTVALLVALLSLLIIVNIMGA
jgi:hypothetical protein